MKCYSCDVGDAKCQDMSSLKESDAVTCDEVGKADAMLGIKNVCSKTVTDGKVARLCAKQGLF